MTALTNNQKILRWAYKGKKKSIGHCITELGLKNEAAFKMLVTNLKNKGLIKAQIIKQRGGYGSVYFAMTKELYYQRAELIIAR